MNRKLFEEAVVTKLKNDNVRKHISINNGSFYIRNSTGQEARFDVAPTVKNVLYTRDDVSNMLDAIISVVCDALARGDRVFIRGFGSLELHRRKGSSVRRFGSDIIDELPDQWVPKFSAGDSLKLAAKLYGLSYSHTGISTSIGGDHDA